MNFNQLNLYRAQHSKFKEESFILFLSFILFFEPHPIYVYTLPHSYRCTLLLISESSFKLQQRT